MRERNRSHTTYKDACHWFQKNPRSKISPNIVTHTRCDIRKSTRVLKEGKWFSTNPTTQMESTNPRGSISCNYVVHATNGYEPIYYPSLLVSRSGLVDDANDIGVHHQTFNAGTDSELLSLLVLINNPFSILPPKPKPRGMYGIIPTSEASLPYALLYPRQTSGGRIHGMEVEEDGNIVPRYRRIGSYYERTWNHQGRNLTLEITRRMGGGNGRT